MSTHAQIIAALKSARLVIAKYDEQTTAQGEGRNLSGIPPFVGANFLDVLDDLTNAPEYPTTFRDWRGNPQPIAWPKQKKTLARDGDVFLLQTGKNAFAVVYGLQVKTYAGHTASEAAHEFGTCCIHQATCQGLAD